MNAQSHHQFGSQQLRIFRRAMRDGETIDAAADAAGMTIGEARLHAKDDELNPPPPEAFELLYDPAGRSDPTSSTPEKEATMARAARKDDDHDNGEGGGISGEYTRPDAKQAIKIYVDEIAPKQAHMSTIKGDLSDPYKRIKDDCHFPRKVLDFLIQLEGMEEAKRDHWLLAMNLGLEELGLHLPRDLVTMAEGDDGKTVVPANKRSRPKLVTVPHPEDDSDLLGDAPEVGIADQDDDFDADEEASDTDD